ncbi:hypothetical protein SSX86_016935 [Deinandra increscens subsp. villosa]|uniref:Peptidase A1 domain-containing protein n=1 Tax=Deinandra increscens subsp. villosa TaxID=3103831 RepID=A0AAP0CYY2_9ASTR
MDLSARTGVVLAILFVVQLASANLVFQVQHKFGGKKKTCPDALKSHDAHRHRRILSAAELPLGGDASPTSAALYYTKIQLGSPPKDFYVQVDTGSDLLWVNCIECHNCPKKSGLGVPLTLFDPKDSSTAKAVGCDNEFCKSTFNGPSDDCKAGMLCAYSVTYGDGSSTAGFFVDDNVTLAQVSGNRQTTSMSGNVIFGCGAKQSGDLGSSDQALDGILGFGQSNSSLLSQLAAAKKVKKTFSHCLDGKQGGGIFAIGELFTHEENWCTKQSHDSVKIAAPPFSLHFPNCRLLQVQHKFGGKKKTCPDALKSHDAHRHRRILSAAELPLGGDASPTSAALYYTKIQLGSPPKDFYVQVDTGSDLLWVNCIECHNCPKKSGLGVPLTLFDPKDSSTAKAVGCDNEFCKSTFNGPSDDCKAGMLCAYSVTYGDGSSTAGFFVDDNVTLAQVSGNRQTTSMSGNVIFGCGAKQSGDLGSSDQALDGILGFGQSNSSLLSQLAAAKKVKKTFSHCLDGKQGGGIFAIGEVVEPKIKTTPILDDQTHFNIALESIDVNGSAVKLPTSIFDFVKKHAAIVDSGTTLAYFPDEVYKQLMEKIIAAQPDNKPELVEKVFLCYKYSGNIDDGFPVVNFHFENSLLLKVLPHQYFFQVEDDIWCIGFQNSNIKAKSGDEITLLGDLVLSDKLVTYDIENQAIGWTDYDCSSSIKVKDEQSGNVYEVGAQDISSAHYTCNSQMILGLLLSLAATYLIN